MPLNSRSQCLWKIASLARCSRHVPSWTPRALRRWIHYRPLDASKREIRLLRVHSGEASALAGGSETSDDVVRCTLSHVSLLDTRDHYAVFRSVIDPTTPRQAVLDQWVGYVTRAMGEEASDSNDHFFRYRWGDYMALSYTWGTSPVTHEIVVNGQRMMVTASLEGALRAFRLSQEPGEDYMLWCDKLCINQQDLEERGQEVKHMRDIYGEARSVFVWLGDEADESDVAIMWAQMIYEDLELRKDVVGKWFYMMDSLKDQNMGLRVHLALYRLFLRPYFRRAWIVQELAMAQSSLVVGCGTKGIELFKLCRVARFITDNFDSFIHLVDEGFRRTTIGSWEYQDGLGVTLTLLNRLNRLRGLAMVPEGQIEASHSAAYEQIQVMENADASDPRDKVYGLLGLLPTQLSSNIKPDYTLPVEKVYADFAISVIQTTKTLDIIHQGNKSLRHSNLPLWIPDWRLPQVDYGIDFTAAPYNTSGSTTAHIELSNNSRLLTCNGFQVDTINGISGTMSPHDTGETELPYTEDAIQPTITNHAYGNDENLVEALARTFLTDHTYRHEKGASVFDIPWLEEDNPDMKELLQALTDRGYWPALSDSSMFQAFNCFRWAIADFSIGGRPLKDFFPTIATMPACTNPAKTVRIMRKVVSRSFTLRPVVTDKGYVGQASPLVVQGDGIYVLEGCKLPVILRPKGPYFEVLASCYIEGIMGGEAMEWLKGGRCQLREITLC
ncbi:hypothetical protein W97_05933 [Coniosporium apollinis CBS 100218]|uniref:Heterokaryon incompatibility domain-containing protein n=1 Tax=Coniosporium apollinis (strain CBS 100218) TaxID=1168221 RepID=R7YXR3_CONA1|nr:uncharacterized protein W97_05933 [Coniosporium apollinis CBS 100218]EON66687.1 hypothetical protein W97_05933 [Coniosporium apollinis CBS 100218]